MHSVVKATISAILAIGISALPVLAEGHQAKKKVLAIFAHPDDEVFVGPALASLAREGAEVTLVLATSGDRGTAFSGLEAGAELAALREGEARCSAKALGIGEPVLLKLGDATLGTQAHREGSAAEQFLASVKELLAEEEHDIVITWGPDGGYGHDDHRMVSALVTEAVQSLEDGRPLLLYPGIRNGTVPPIEQLQSWAQTDPGLLSVTIAYDAPDREAADRSVQCHVSQFDQATRDGLVPLFDASIWQGAVHFRPAFGD